ncbi:MAG: hypothetical protein JJ978_01020 [Roseivirga sp.]|jgi:hypothetical protein|uniref:Ser-Thr-rich GPI-anchored membrane family protein n=1 Tax=Roseivirga sp. TaxID=1964215 RepID=UPI001B21F424|nr:Ser-Thr-rich GPI-anchored membrane family protein [Roseivirga sp.]MBO6494122.1 hypothetical protein [Roseivirga sp.]
MKKNLFFTLIMICGLLSCVDDYQDVSALNNSDDTKIKSPKSCICFATVSVSSALRTTGGDKIPISWQAVGEIDNNFYLELFKGGVYVQQIAFVNNVSSGYNQTSGVYHWTVPSGLIAGEDYSIGIRYYDNIGASDNFAIFDGFVWNFDGSRSDNPEFDQLDGYDALVRYNSNSHSGNYSWKFFGNGVVDYGDEGEPHLYWHKKTFDGPLITLGSEIVLSGWFYAHANSDDDSILRIDVYVGSNFIGRLEKVGSRYDLNWSFQSDSWLASSSGNLRLEMYESNGWWGLIDEVKLELR